MVGGVALTDGWGGVRNNVDAELICYIETRAEHKNETVKNTSQSTFQSSPMVMSSG